ncbi:aldehyde dehydrogenase family protein [Halomonas sp. DN3]|uniref:aldehyde dehydrogenase family protein n=1 Tax=Halomonas sp. DN3 TaxID=2953657 RepID=UPI00209EDF75|nr:aldehyde dehydrogenase family protein [Halomonas sp. DN3]USZ50248.1 aldehyde dehydrogenase family protein [Halomonas sp. DN3]
MHYREHFFINGRWHTPSDSERFGILDPATENLCASVPRAHRADINAAVEAARRALPDWSATPAGQRREILLAVADEMQRRHADLVEAHVITLGCPVQITPAMHVDGPIEGMRYYAERASRTEEIERRNGVAIVREPVGVCALINPWNYPLHQLVGKLAPALAAGCTVVTKPAEQTPLQDFIMAEIFQSVGLPAGVFNLVTGSGNEIGPLLASHPGVDMVSFTGSTRAGIEVAINAAAGVKRVCQELGGKSPLIITADADLTRAVRFGVENVMANSGQTCDAFTRMLIPRSRLVDAERIALTVAGEQVVGDPADTATTMGPLVSRRQRDSVRQYIEQGVAEGARLMLGGTESPEGLEQGYYVRPTLFSDVSNDMAIARSEIFGPVLCLIPYDDLEQAIEIANDTPYGLSSAVYAASAEAALPIARRLKAGQCYLQGAEFSFDAPFGGYGQSGNGREWGEEGLEEYLETKAILGG